MGLLGNEIISACSTYGVRCSIISAEEAEKLRALVESKFAETGTKTLWERLINASYHHDVRGWARIADFTKDESIYVFFKPVSDNSVIKIEESSRLSEVLGETTGFVFYITNLSCDYLICFDDHDTLIGVGTAKQWVEKLNSTS